MFPCNLKYKLIRLFLIAMEWILHSVLQTLYKLKFLMPDLLVYLNPSFLIHIRARRINTLFSELDLPSMIQPHFLQMYSLLPYVCWLVMWRTFSLFRVFGNILLCLQNIVCSGEVIWVSKYCSHHPSLYKWRISELQMQIHNSNRILNNKQSGLLPVQEIPVSRQIPLINFCSGMKKRVLPKQGWGVYLEFPFMSTTKERAL